jgi:glycogen debranching enzyme
VDRPIADEDEDRYSILATASPTLTGARVLKHGDTFAVFDAFGDIRPLGIRGAQGLYHEGTRHLSELRLRLGGERMPLLSSTVRDNNVVLAVDLTNPDLLRQGHLVLAHGTLHLLRSKLLWQGACHEQLQVSNYGATAVDVELELSYAADFADVFEVRGTRRERRGALHEPVVEDGVVLLACTGLDGVTRRTRIFFDPAPTVTGGTRALFRLHVEARQTRSLYLTVACEERDADRPRGVRFEEAHADASAALRDQQAEDCEVVTSNSQFDEWFERSLSDLRMMITETPHGPYPYAGVPWYSTPFGRDAIITALESLWISPDLARGVLRFLAATQAERSDAEADAEPGKIVHEIRRGEMAALREIPFGRYYGSVDATPLFVVLADAYCEHTGDVATIAALWQHIERALAWMERHGDVDGDGFVEYGRRSATGLVQQGWKDSHDSVFHADGSPAEGPIALCEVQGYVYAALVGAARMAGRLGEDERARVLRAEAERLRERFDATFWDDELGTYVLALDGAKRPCRVRTSNAGHCLFSGVALPERAPRIAEQLLSADGFSGWGIRTLGACERRYNPMSYHNGSIWPHDNALVACGLSRYGLKQDALRVLSALFDAALSADLHRLPELYCGFERRPGEGPTAYPVACSPQAWSAAAIFMALQAVLGLCVEGAAGRVRFKSPALPEFLERVLIRNLRVGAGRVDVALHRYPEDVGIHVTGRRGKVEVIVIK